MGRAILFLLVFSSIWQDAICQSIQLAPPNVNIVRGVITQEMAEVKYDFRMDNAEIRFTTDGTSPTKVSNIYISPILIKTPCVVKARVFHDEFLPSDEVISSFYQISKSIDTIHSNPAGPKYSAKGEKTIYDRILGSLNFSQHFLGYNGQNLQATLTWKKRKQINTIHVSYLVHQGAWIFGPKEIRVYDSNHHLVTNILLQENESDTPAHNKVIAVKVPKKKYQKLLVEVVCQNKIPQWHQGSGQSAWLFIDEIWVD